MAKRQVNRKGSLPMTVPMYEEDLARLDAVIRELAQAGAQHVNRSMLARLALRQLLTLGPATLLTLLAQPLRQP